MAIVHWSEVYILERPSTKGAVTYLTWCPISGLLQYFLQGVSTLRAPPLFRNIERFSQFDHSNLDMGVLFADVS